jgi:hypothetical protein
MSILTCSQEFRDLLLKEYPELEVKPKDYIAKGHWRHLISLLFASEHKGIYIGQLQIARDYQVWNKLKNNHLVAIEYINNFRSKILNYTLHEYNHYSHIARTATVEFPKHIIEGRNKLLLKNNKDKHEVFICSGRKFNSKSIANLKKEDNKLVPQIQGAIMPPLATKFQDYLNSLPPNIFTKMLKHKNETYNYIHRKDSNGTYVLTEEQRYLLALHLHSIEERPQPIYVGSRQRNTIRLFEMYMGLQGVHSDLRKILTQDWVELDLQNAHLAIVAKLWDIPIVKEYLITGKSIWESLLPYMGIPLEDRLSKSTIKTFLYGCVYGMSKETLETDMIALLGKDKHQKFISHPVINAVLKARAQRIKEIRNRGGVDTYLGERIHVIRYKNEDNQWEDNLLTILSQEASEFEMLLLEPILDLSIASKQEFHMTLYQFDGVSLHFRNSSKKDSHLKNIKKTVDKRAKELDILTTIIIK